MGHSDNSEAKRAGGASSPVIVLTPMTSGDRGALAALWIAAWRETMPDIDFDARRDWIVAFLEDPAHVTLVASMEGRAVGFVSTEQSYLHQLAVSPSAKGRGVATALLDAVKTRGALRLDVNQANGRAVRFYEREGFVRVGAGQNPSSGLATWTLAWP